MTARALDIVVKAQGAAAAAGAISKVDQKVGALNRKSGTFATTLNKRVSGAVGTFSGRLRGLAGASIGLLGVGGLFTLGAAFKSAMEHAREFGDASIQLARVTGQSVDAASRMVDALDFFGIKGEKATKIAGMLTKNVGNLVRATGGAAKFQKDYGLKITDSSGHVLKFNEQLKESADFFTNKSIPATKKAAALAKIYGRNWQDLIPILAKGRAGVTAELARSMHISEADLAAITANKQATREWDDAIGDLQTRIGIDLMPTLTDMVSTLTGFVSEHGEDIRSFFKNAVEGGKKFGGAALEAVQAIKAVWDGIPDPIKDLFIKGLIADRTVKFLFGFSIKDLAGDLLGGAAKGLGGALVKAGIGKAFVQPVFVTNMGAGLGGGVGGAGGTGILGLLGGLIGLTAVAGLELAIADAIGPSFRKFLTGSEAPFASNPYYQRPENQNVYQRARGGDPNWKPGGKTMGGDPRNLSEGNRAIVDAVQDSKDKMESMRIALASKTDAVRSNLTSQGSRIVSAINNLDLSVKVTVPLSLRVDSGGSGHGDKVATGLTVKRVTKSVSSGPSGTSGPGHGA